MQKITYIYFFDNGKIAATANIHCTQLLSASEAEKYKKETSPGIIFMLSQPRINFYKLKTNYRISSNALGLSFDLPQHNLSATEVVDQKLVKIDYSGMSEITRAAHSLNPAITLKLVKKLASNEKFAAIAAPYLKQSVNNELNGYDAKKYPAFKNMVVFKKRWEYRPGHFGDFPEPYRYLFEYNGYVYDLSGEVLQKTIMDSLLKTIQAYKGPSTNMQNGTTGKLSDGVSGESINRYLLLGMEAWLKDRFLSVKGNEIPSSGFGNFMTTRYATVLKAGTYSTEIVEKGTVPDKRRDWVIIVDSFENKVAAAQAFKKLCDSLLSFKHEKFQLKQVQKSDEEVVWMPHALHNDLPPELSKVEIRVLLNERFFVANGKIEMRYEVLITVGCQL